MDLINLNSFLKFGYFLKYKTKKKLFDFGESKIDLSNYNKNELIFDSGNLFQSAINSNFKNNEKHLVPISGGLDSRAILAGLLENTEAKNIYTFTFGQPGSYDFEIGNYISNKIGTNHQSYNLKQTTWDQDELINTAQRFSFQTNLFYHPNTSNILSEYKGINYWSGFMGDPIAGSHFVKNVKPNRLKSNFITKNTFVKSTNLCCCEDEDFFKLIEINNKLKHLISDTENIDFTNRQLKYISPHVLFKGLKVITPFLNKDWSNFMLSLDSNYRFETSLYQDMLFEKYPSLFSLPTKAYMGLGLRPNKFKIFSKKIKHRIRSKINIDYQNPNINYLDFNYEIKYNKQLREILISQTRDLKNRKIVDWIDIDKLWRKHIKKEKNYSDALITLASLEINLKAGKEI